LLKLPPSYARKLALLTPSTPGEWAIPAPVVVAPAPAAKRSRSPRRFAAAVAGVGAALVIFAGVGVALAKSTGGPVGISKHTPKKIEHVVRTPSRQTGAHVHAPPAVTTHAARPHAKRKH
jgi:hypothetical protein